jgi:YbbR domain-containing protein
MNNLWFQIIISFLLGAILFFIIEYFSYKFFEKKNKTIFTQGISDNEITFTKDYQEILTAQLGEKLLIMLYMKKCFAKFYISIELYLT